MLLEMRLEQVGCILDMWNRGEVFYGYVSSCSSFVANVCLLCDFAQLFLVLIRVKRD